MVTPNIASGCTSSHDELVVKGAVARVLLTTLAAGFSTGCNLAEPEAPADNLLFVSFDTTRADHLTPYGYPQDTSPTVAALADKGTLFERAFSHVPSTLSAHSSMFTGLLPASHGVRCNGIFRLAAEHRTLAEILRDHGFATAAVLGAFPLDPRFGTDQGFGVYDADFSSSAATARRRKGQFDDPGSWFGHEYPDFERRADEVTDLGIAWLGERERDSRRWFLFAHYFDPHWPYEPSPEYAAKFASDYDSEIAYADTHLRRLLDYVEKLPGRTLVVFTADHGEGLQDHGESMHGRYIYNSTLHVPLIISLEGFVRAGARVKSNVGHVDLMPTVLELLDLEVPSGVVGQSLVRSLREDYEPENRPHYSETLVGSLERASGVEVRSLLDGEYKVVLTEIRTETRSEDRLELYDIEQDRGERIDLSLVDPDRTAAMADRLGRWREELDRTATKSDVIELDDGARERLRSLGYL
jgi:arylsulfatase A-like enzyme